MKKYDVLLIGGGLVGLASAWQLLRKNPKQTILLLEKEEGVAKHQSGRNSGVIHSGIYYDPQSEKSNACTRGYRLLLEFCQENEIPYELSGKLIVAREEAQFPALDRLIQNAKAIGLSGVSQLTREQIIEKEPFVEGKKALWVPQAGRINYVQVAEKLLQKIQEMGGEVCFSEKALSIRELSSVQVETDKGAYEANIVLNCGGLFSDRITTWTEKDIDLKIIPFRGEYYELRKEKQNIIRSMVYPAPDFRFPFLGVHFTKTMNSTVEVGPNAILALKREGYSWKDISVKDTLESLSWPGFQRFALKHWKQGFRELSQSLCKYSFLREARKMVPSLELSDLANKRSGVRAQACNKAGHLLDDFIFFRRANVVHLANVPSPAATSCFSIGERVMELLEERIF